MMGGVGVTILFILPSSPPLRILLLPCYSGNTGWKALGQRHCQKNKTERFSLNDLFQVFHENNWKIVLKGHLFGYPTYFCWISSIRNALHPIIGNNEKLGTKKKSQLCADDIPEVLLDLKVIVKKMSVVLRWGDGFALFVGISWLPTFFFFSDFISQKARITLLQLE